MITYENQLKIESEMDEIVRRSAITCSWFDWDTNHFDFITEFGDLVYRVIVEGDTVEEIIDSICFNVNNEIEDMKFALENSKLKRGKQ